MRVRLPQFPTIASLFLTLVVAACSGAEAATDTDSNVTSVPIFTLAPTVASVSVATTIRPEVTQAVVVTASPIPEPTTVPTLTPRSAPAPPPATPTSIPVGLPTETPEPTQIPTSQATIPPTATSEPTPTSQPATPTAIPPTATAIPAPAMDGVTQLTGFGSGNSDVFWSPKHLPWLVEWDAKGTESHAVVLTLMDPDGDIELLELVSDSGTGQIGGLIWVVGNMGKFYVRVEGAEADWTIWIRLQ